MECAARIGCVYKKTNWAFVQMWVEGQSNPKTKRNKNGCLLSISAFTIPHTLCSNFMHFSISLPLTQNKSHPLCNSRSKQNSLPLTQNLCFSLFHALTSR